MNFLNIHTHSTQNQAEEDNIYNIIIPQDTEEIDFQLNDTLEYSIGIHPWYTHEDSFETQLATLKKWAKHPSIRLIGEAGLDRIRGTSLANQEKIFLQQIRIAEEIKKPLIIHCVRCYSELVSIQKIIRPKIPLIVHGYNNHPTIANTLIERGFYLSFGKALLHENSNAQKVFSSIPIDKIFLETDDEDISIQEIYQKAAFLRNMSDYELKSSIFANYSVITTF